MTTEQFDHKAYLAYLESQLAGIEEERAQIERKQNLLQETIGKVKQLAAMTPNAITQHTTDETSRDSIVVPKDLFKGMNHIVEAAIKLLRRVQKPLRNRILVDTLVSGGFPTKAKEPYITFRSVLTRAMKEKGTFTYHNKEWGLPEWDEPQTEGNYGPVMEEKAEASKQYAEGMANRY